MRGKLCLDELHHLSVPSLCPSAHQNWTMTMIYIYVSLLSFESKGNKGGLHVLTQHVSACSDVHLPLYRRVISKDVVTPRRNGTALYTCQSVRQGEETSTLLHSGLVYSLLAEHLFGNPAGGRPFRAERGIDANRRVGVQHTTFRSEHALCRGKTRGASGAAAGSSPSSRWERYAWSRVQGSMRVTSIARR